MIEDLTVIGEDDSVLAGFTAITKPYDDGTAVICLISYITNTLFDYIV